MLSRFCGSALLVTWLMISLVQVCSAASIAPPKKTHSKSRKVTDTPSTQKKIARSKHSTKTAAATTSAGTTKAIKTVKVSKRGRKSRYYERFSGNSFASDQVDGDITTGEDPIVRAAAVEAM